MQFPAAEWLAKNDSRMNSRWEHIRLTLSCMCNWSAIKGWHYYQTSGPNEPSMHHWIVTDAYGKTKHFGTRECELMIERFCKENDIIWRPVVYRDTTSLQRIERTEVLEWMVEEQRKRPWKLVS